MTPVFDKNDRRVELLIPIPAENTTDGVLNTTKNGAAYYEVDLDMEIDEVFLSFAMSADVNTAGSGNFGVGVYVDNVSLTSAQIAVAYSSANPYTSKARSELAVDTLNDGDLLRLDILQVPGGASTSYPMNALVRIVGHPL
jgi:hypothetical protein